MRQSGEAPKDGEASVEAGRYPPDAVLAQRYRVLGVLGEGGMGVVYEVVHVEIDRAFALKVLHRAYSGYPDALERFRAEARAASRIGHPNIVDVLDFGTTERGEAFFAMELLEGESLGQRIEATGGPLPLATTLDLLTQLLDALAAAHAAEIIHRDLKPENVFLVPESGGGSMVKVLDFGLAKSPELAPSTRRLTQAGQFLGTPGYMAPEQISGAGVQVRTDLYAIGCIAYEMLTGEMVFPEKEIANLLYRHANEPPLPPSTRRPDARIPLAVDELVLAALAKDPTARPASAAEMATTLRSIASAEGVALQPPKVPSRRPKTRTSRQGSSGAAPASGAVGPASVPDKPTVRLSRLPELPVTKMPASASVPPRRPKWRLLLAIPVAGVALAGALFGVLRPAATHLVVASDPAGAEVLIDGKSLGHTPLTLHGVLPAGPHGLELRAPKRPPVRRELALRGGVEERQEVSLGRPRRVLRVGSRPPGAFVAVDNTPSGVTPLEVELAYDVVHMVRLELSGFEPWQHWVDDDAAGELVVDLRRDAPP